MADAVIQRLTVDEFFDWCPKNDDTHWELIDGCPMAMAPTSRAHMRLLSKVVRHIDEALDDKAPCATETGAGIVPPNRADTYYGADLAVTCRSTEIGERGITPDPILIVEVLSPSTERTDRRGKLPDYCAIPSVREIVFVDQASLYCEVYRPLGEDGWKIEHLRGADGRLRLDSVGLDIALGVLYANVPVEPDPVDERPDA